MGTHRGCYIVVICMNCTDMISTSFLTLKSSQTALMSESTVKFENAIHWRFEDKDVSEAEIMISEQIGKIRHNGRTSNKGSALRGITNAT